MEYKVRASQDPENREKFEELKGLAKFKLRKKNR